MQTLSETPMYSVGLTAEEAVAVFSRFAEACRSLPPTETKTIWFWERQQHQRDGWRVFPGLRSFAVRMAAA